MVATSAGSLLSSVVSVTPNAPGDGSQLTSNFNDSTSSDGRCPGRSFDFSCTSARTLAFAHLAGPPINPPNGREPGFDESFASTIDTVRVPPCGGSFVRGGGRPGIGGCCFRLRYVSEGMGQKKGEHYVHPVRNFERFPCGGHFDSQVFCPSEGSHPFCLIAKNF